MILENNMSEAGSMATSKKKTTSNNDITRALNFGNVSTQVSFNDGNSEGYYKVRPKALKPSDHNPRPDWVIDDNWLIKHVGVDMHDIFESDTDSNCLVKLQEDTVDNKSVEYAIYPEFEDLLNSPNVAQKKEYEFLVNLSKSIRTTGQIQPIEIESNTESNTLVVLEGHLRRLACILGRVPYIKAIRNEGLHNLSRKEKIERQITENSLRSNVTVYGNYKLACEEIEEGKKLTVRDLSSRLKIQRDLAAAFIKLISNPIKYHPLILQTLAAGNLSANNLIKVVSLGRQDRQESFLIKLLQKNNLISSDVAAPIISRGTEGRKRSVASMQIKTTENCIKAGNKLLSCIPDLKSFSNISEVSSVDDMVSLLKSFEDFLLEVNREI
jgi:ParB-like chromosome segregation protein Spo0J